MKVKEFAEKYGLDYGTVYRETYNVSKVGPTVWRGQEYDEEELKNAIRKSALLRIEEHERKIRHDREILEKIGE